MSLLFISGPPFVHYFLFTVVSLAGAAEFMRGRKSAAEFTALAAFNGESKENKNLACQEQTFGNGT